MFPPGRLRALAAAAVCACALASPGRAAVSYHFQWSCTGCGAIGGAANGREGPFASPAECENARTTMAANLSMRGCGMGCFKPLLCESQGAPETPREPPDISLPGRAYPPVYGTSARRRAQQAEEERDQAEREAAARNGEQARSGAPPGLASNWRNAFSRYQVRRSRDSVEIVLTETCAVPDCSRKTNPDRPVFRGRLEGDRLVGAIVIHAAVESVQNGNRCLTPAGDFPIQGRISGDGDRIVWEHAELPTQPGCRAASLSLGAWRRER